MPSKINPTETSTQTFLFCTVGNTKELEIEDRQRERYDVSGTLLWRGNALGKPSLRKCHKAMDGH